MKLRDSFDGHGLWFQPLSEKWLELVRLWRNDPRCREQFHDSSVISWDRQWTWFHKTYLPATETDAVWVFGESAHGAAFTTVGQVSLYAAEYPRKVTFGRFMVGQIAALGAGLGERATKATVERAFALGFEMVDLDVKEQNDRAIRLYERCGFVETRRADGLVAMEIRQ